MKPFDLEAAKRGADIQTRDGKAATFIAHVPEADGDCRVVVLSNGSIYSNREDGSFWSDGAESSCDLFMAPTKRRVDVYLNLSPKGLHHGYQSRHAADRYANPDRLGGKAHHVVIEWED